MQFKYFEPTSKIINLSIEIGKLLGVIDSTYLRKPNTKLRKSNQIKSIHSSLAIEGNTLSEKQITDIINNQSVFGPAKDILEVKNAIKAYDQIGNFKYDSLNSYLSAHKLLMQGLIKSPGRLRTQGVGVFKGNKASHIAPPAWNVQNLMENLFKYLKQSNDSLIIKSCVFHYEMEFIHPFLDGNGRMGRLWQTVILIKENPVFEFLPIEQNIKSKQEEYYGALELSDKSGKCTVFVTFMLSILKSSLDELIKSQRINFSDTDRINYFLENYKENEFARKEYLEMFKDISTATATRDLKKGIQNEMWVKIGEDRLTKYKIKKMSRT